MRWKLNGGVDELSSDRLQSVAQWLLEELYATEDDLSLTDLGEQVGGSDLNRRGQPSAKKEPFKSWTLAEKSRTKT